jgi:hypothetical protein
MAEFNLNELYQKTYGYVGPPYPTAGIPDPRNLLPIKDFRQLDLGISKRKTGKVTGSSDKGSMLGAELRMPCKIRIPGGEWFQLPNEPIVSLEMSKDIVLTSLNRGKKRFTVKEEINLDDYKITIRGIAYNDQDDDYPNEIRLLRRHMEHPGALEINCYMCEIFNISLITVNRFNVPRTEGMPFRMQTYDITALSDDDFEKELLNDS